MRFEERELKEYAEPVLPDHRRWSRGYSLAPEPNPKPLSFISKTLDPTSVGFASSHQMLMKKPHL
jgi:hypothetical protein